MSLFDKKHLVSPVGALSGCNTPISVATLHVVDSHSTTSASDGMEIAILAMSYFWGVERLFWQLPGVYSTAVGYIGGHMPNPAYQGVCPGDTGHAEAVRIVYDPSVISYERLLQVFQKNHNLTQGMRQDNDHGTQYRSAICPPTPEQGAAAHASLERFRAAMPAADNGRYITTETVNAISFYYVGDDHQQYLYRNPYGYCGIGGIGICLPPEAQCYGYKCSLSIKCFLSIPDAV